MPSVTRDVRARIGHRTSVVAIIALLVVTAVAAPLWYVATVVERESAFVAVAEDVLVAPSVRTFVAQATATLVIDAIEADPELTSELPDSVRGLVVPLTRVATAQLVDLAFRTLGDGPAASALDAALREVHRQLTASGDAVTLDLTAVLVRVAREIGGPAIGFAVANAVQGDPSGQVVLVEPGGRGAGALAAVRAIPNAGWALLVVMVGLAVVALVAATERRRALIGIGVSLIAGSVVAIVAVVALLQQQLAGDEIGADVADVISADFADQQRAVQLVGASLVLTGVLIGRSRAAVALRRLPGDLWRHDGAAVDSIRTVVAANPPAVRIAVWLTGVLLLVGWPAPTGRVVATVLLATAAGLVLVWLSTSDRPAAVRWRHGADAEVPTQPSPASSRLRLNLGALTVLAFLLWPAWDLRLVVDAFAFGAFLQVLVDLPAARAAARAGRVPTDAGDRRTLVQMAVAGGVVVVAVVGAGALFARSASTVAEASEGCNGSVDLCDRRIDEVVFAGSHNAMASSDLGWELAPQLGDMVAQLDHGVRALLIDTHYWDRSGEIEGGDDAAVRLAIERALSDDTPRPGTWLCHGFCALGATRLDEGLASIRVWLDANPNEVVLMIVQDAITTADTFEAFETSGLLDLVYEHRPGTPYPTLGELVEENRRLLVWAESQGRPDSWYQNAYDSTFQETGYDFASIADFDCAPNRGDDGNPLFLVNHWLSTGVPTVEAATVVNRRRTLVDRIEQCALERGRRPTILATDFVEVGDLVDVVADLNAGEIVLDLGDRTPGDPSTDADGSPGGD